MSAMADPAGWTSNINAKDKVEDMLAVATKLPGVSAKLAEISGTQYLFQSGTAYYFWNSANEEGGRVTNPTTYPAILTQMGADITKIQVTLL